MEDGPKCQIANPRILFFKYPLADYGRMAKSIRSKRMRKLRAFKRIRYGQKELERLTKMLDKAKADENAEQIEAVVTLPSNIEKNSVLNIYFGGEKQESPVETMEVDNSENVQKKPVQKQKYPCWLSHFKIRKLAKQERRRKRKETKRLKKEQSSKKQKKSGRNIK